MTNKIVDDEQGKRMLIVDPPSSDDARRLRGAGVRTAWVHGFGMASLPDLSILDGAIDHLSVLTLNIESDAAVMTLPGLHSLSLQTYARDRIDFGAFESLNDLTFHWRPGAESALGLHGLKSLSIFKFPFGDLSALGGLTELRRLGIWSARIERLDGIGAFRGLQSLFLVDDRRLVDLTALAGDAPRLRGLDFNGCRSFRDISPLAAQVDLEELSLTDCGRIESLAPLATLKKLKRLWFYGSTVIEDGDMSVLLDLPLLHGCSFTNRRHYGHRSQDIEAELERRHGPYVTDRGHAWLRANA